MQRLHVLLVEDDDDTRALYGLMLLKAGFHVSTVRSGIEALALMQANRPDVVVTDLAMPMLDGVQLIRLIRGRNDYADLPLIAMTVYGEKLRQLATEAGANMAMDKPISEAEMYEAVVSVMPSEGN